MAAFNPDKALIFRMIHRANLAWVIEHGLQARNHADHNPNHHAIGNPELIDRRSRRKVPISPGGTLDDYVPFYFTPFSIMMYNIKTGYGGIPKVPNHDILILVSSLHKIARKKVPFVFTDGHAYSATTSFYNDLGALDQVDWPLLQSRNFRHDPDDPGRKERYQAEALVWQHVAVDVLLGICCNNPSVQAEVQETMNGYKLPFEAVVERSWYF